MARSQPRYALSSPQSTPSYDPEALESRKVPLIHLSDSTDYPVFRYVCDPVVRPRAVSLTFLFMYEVEVVHYAVQYAWAALLFA